MFKKLTLGGWKISSVFNKSKETPPRETYVPNHKQDLPVCADNGVSSVVPKHMTSPDPFAVVYQ